MTKGFITLATGNERYFKMAVNLLKSYRLFSENPLPFAILTDRHNQYTEQFDEVIILENPKYSYLDKLSVLVNCPYDETIFIDADCLAYHDLNDYWNVCDFSSTLSCFGNSFPLDNKTDGWFKREDIGEYGKEIKFIPHVHGGVYFNKNTSQCKEIFKLATEISENYFKYKFKFFDQPADEPIIALCMAIFNCRPIVEKRMASYFYPDLKNFKADIFQGSNSCLKYSEFVTNAYIIHWQNINTDKAAYKSEVDKLNILYNRQMKLMHGAEMGSVDNFTRLKLKSKIVMYKSIDFYKDTIVSIKSKVWHLLNE